MKLITSLLVMCTVLTGWAQRDMDAVATAVSQFTDQLENRGIDTYFTTQRYCQGETQMHVMPDGSNCFSQGTYVAVYVVWSENDETMIKKIDNCGLHLSVALADNALYDFFESKVDNLQNNKVKPYKIAEKEGGPMQRTDINNCHRKFQFVDEVTSGEQAYMLFDVTNTAKEQNLNYQYNAALDVVVLDAMMDTAIAEMEANAGFRRQ